MKISYLSASYLISDSANSVHVTRMCQAFSHNGHEVRLHALMGEGSAEEIHDYYGVEPVFEIERHREETYLPSQILRTLRRNFSFFKVGAIPSILYGYGCFANMLKAQKPDLIFSRNLDWLLGCAGTGIPFVAESHHPPRNKMDKALQSYLFRHPMCRRLVVISQALKKLYLEALPELDESKIIVAHDGADAIAEPYVQNKGPKSGNLQVGYVGHLYEGRGGELIVDLAHELPDIDFHIVGGRAEDIARLTEKTPPQNLTFHGQVARKEVDHFLKSFDVVLAPYQKTVRVSGNSGNTSDFMSPMKIFEYMSWGKAILCSDLPVLREVLQDGDNCLLLPCDRMKDWRNALEKLNDSWEFREKIAQKAFEDFNSKYTWKQRAKTILDGIHV